MALFVLAPAIAIAATGAGWHEAADRALADALRSAHPAVVQWSAEALIGIAAPEPPTPLLAQALAPGLRVVGLAPGLTLTSHLLSQEKFEQLHRLSPLGRSSTPQDVAAAVRFALENRSITGTTLLVDGGQHLMKFERDFSLM